MYIRFRDKTIEEKMKHKILQDNRAIKLPFLVITRVISDTDNRNWVLIFRAIPGIFQMEWEHVTYLQEQKILK